MMCYPDWTADQWDRFKSNKGLFDPDKCTLILWPDIVGLVDIVPLTWIGLNFYFFLFFFLGNWVEIQPYEIVENFHP
jgi:hypothetical protein